MSVREITDIKMELSKVVFVAVFALCAIQAQSAEIPEFRNATHLNLRVIFTNGAAIAKNLFTALNSGMDKSKPNVNVILNEMAPEAKDLARKTIDKVRGVIRDEEKRVDYVFKTLGKALDTMKPIKPCYDKHSSAAKKIFNSNEKQFVDLVEKINRHYGGDIRAVKAKIKKIVDTARKVFDTQVDATIKCLKPGRKDIKECLNRVVDDSIRGITEFFVDIIIVIENPPVSFLFMMDEIRGGLNDIFLDLVLDLYPLLGDLADCVSKMKA